MISHDFKNPNSLFLLGHHQQSYKGEVQVPAEVLPPWRFLPGRGGGCVQEGLLRGNA